MWTFFFGLAFAGMFFFDKLLVNALEWDQDEAEGVQQYLVFAAPALYFWGVVDAHRRFINSYENFWTPCFTMVISICIHPFTCSYLLNSEKLGLYGLAMAQLITNFGSYFFMRLIANMHRDMRKALFFPRCKTCANIWQYLSYGIP